MAQLLGGIELCTVAAAFLVVFMLGNCTVVSVGLHVGY